MGIQNRTKEEIHTLEIFPRTPMEEVLQPQPDTGMGEKTIRYLERRKLVKGVEFIQKGFFLQFKNEDSEKKMQEKLRIFSLEMEGNSGCERTEQGNQTTHFKMNGTDQVRDLIRKEDQATSLDLKSAFHHLIVFLPHRPYLAFETMGKVYQYRAMPFGTQHSPIFFAHALAM
ncbi:MAG: hypothetical protein EZS28_054225, partial [Streblomastix strix]